MSEDTKSITVTIQNPQGLHLRPAYLVANAASQFDSKIELVKDDMRIDGKSALAILTLCAAQGTELALQATGSDANKAIQTLESLFDTGFPEAEQEADSTT